MSGNAGNRGEKLSLVAPVAETSPPGPESSSTPRNTILVIDDEIDTRAALSEALEDAGYAVFVAANGNEGLRLLPRLKKPLGVILDITMPVMSGVELYKIMKATPALADIPVVISTSDPDRAPEGAALIKKPVSLERLLATVARLF